MAERRPSDETFMEKDERLDGLLRSARAPQPDGLAQTIARELVKANLGLADPLEQARGQTRFDQCSLQHLHIPEILILGVAVPVATLTTRGKRLCSAPIW